ncbi:cupin domain-containing protein [Rhizobium grahamii]|uniref:Cupin domain-containing protein n=1 Tax=Rhizobium grahamii TaxID=1120045 RepID=A0A5Q0CDK1_9HYPH|nr:MULTISPECIES: cupin domain-containing protein [Rhizobium]QFY62200.1 cupin domain-containing protein [Rhizobium grahamii]QRM48614.1 cupin domain-containing protein [Rhizobium sp. BG6]
MRDRNLIQIGTMEIRFLIDEDQSSESLVMFEFTVPSQARVPAAHFHRDVDEVIYGLSGTMTTTLDGKKHEIRAGETLFIPRGYVHTHENLHGETAKVLITMTPGLIGRRYFEEMASAINVQGKPDIEHVKEIMRLYGLMPV